MIIGFKLYRFFSQSDAIFKEVKINFDSKFEALLSFHTAILKF